MTDPTPKIEFADILRLSKGEQYFFAALIDLAFLEKIFTNGVPFRESFSVRIPIASDEYLTDGVMSPDYIHTTLFLHSFIEKSLKFISLLTNAKATIRSLRACDHNLEKLLAYALITQRDLKNAFGDEDYRICDRVFKLNYSYLRYLSRNQEIIFKYESLLKITSYFKEKMLSCRASNIYSIEYRDSFVRRLGNKYPITIVSIPVSKEAPKIVNKEDFENITTHKSYMYVSPAEDGFKHLPSSALTDIECNFLISCYEFKNSKYHLKSPIDNQTSRRIFKLFSKAEYTLPSQTRNISVGRSSR
ncbi:hypothetical protein [Leptospira stimsonii]|uniref:Uncharacterized protein n=1 Tax=Leptospira stimsonii TaxID=2202203 RepID=A0A8B3CH93_9LEPT|nr:hypothetical protein [Leptospira stimsonii]RHX83210.1 hypothetical protein DLM78_22135 [Leptospira stimsonii]